ncbi:SIR2 family protein [Blastopirellula sp. JC732]|uniref:SIR2 family protein n=1 Tax=Blastopirellula sediminis TaxID=2894196 RepID=A0A9X1SFX5_9BACT|nr:SIR2 family protein [Blastopirellula sediminis]MCC9608425.1 SIR2 family protein [Blastopirellula sediminis]MCC9628798.1 SIR2 family protein [Blastopirellula sediminis]
MTDSLLNQLVQGIRSGEIVPYLGPGALSDVVHKETDEPIPATSDGLILAMNGGKPMAPKLMWEFARAAMNLELKKGRTFISRFLTDTYGHDKWTQSRLHKLVADLNPHLVLDINRDTQLQDLYAETPHTLIVGLARIAGTDFRYRLYHYQDGAYREVKNAEVDVTLPVLFKPMGTPRPSADYIASDADYVDYITELMGGFAIPGFVKEYRLNRQYLGIGLRLTRDTERMVFTDMIYSAGDPAGWVLIESPTAKERRFCESKRVEIIEASTSDLLQALEAAQESAVET